MALTYTTYTPDTSSALGGDITTTSRSYTSGDLVGIVVVSSEDANVGVQTISNSGTAQTWSVIAATAQTGNCRVAGWSCVMSTTQSMTITVAGDGASTVDSAAYVIAHAGQHATTPIPAGNIFEGVNGNDVTQAITPTSPGSCLWMVVGDYNQANALSAATNVTKEYGTDQAGQQTTALYRPTTQPRADTSAFTIGSASDGTTENEAWIAFEIQAAAGAGQSQAPRSMHQFHTRRT